MISNNDQYFIVESSGNQPTNYNSINVLEYTASTTYSPSSNLLYARVVCVGGGGGGGSGRVATATNTMTGGAGGGGGAMAFNTLYYTDLTEPSYDIIIGSGGTGASAKVSVGSSNGTNGQDGGITSFGSLVIADSGKGGAGGSNSTTLGGAGGSVFNCVPNVYGLSKNGIMGANSNSGNGNAATPTTPGVSYVGCGMINGIGTGGASGGGAVTTTILGIGGAGGRAIDTNGSLTAVVAGGATGTTGTNGADNVSLQIIGEYPMTSPINTLGIGLSGSGGGASKTVGVPGGNGGDGGLYGAGGGGGGCGLNGGAPNGSGAGGNGAQGLCIIIEFLS
jgi:hypothetical protein